MAALFSPAPAAATPISTGHASAFESFRLRLPRASPVSPRADDLSGECDQEHATRRLRSLAAQEPAYAPNADYIETVRRSVAKINSRVRTGGFATQRNRHKKQHRSRPAA